MCQKHHNAAWEQGFLWRGKKKKKKKAAFPRICAGNPFLTNVENRMSKTRFVLGGGGCSLGEPAPACSGGSWEPGPGAEAGQLAGGLSGRVLQLLSLTMLLGIYHLYLYNPSKLRRLSSRPGSTMTVPSLPVREKRCAQDPS